MSLLRNSLAVAAAVAIAVTTVVLMPPLENRPVPVSPGEVAKKAPPEKGETTAASVGPENHPSKPPPTPTTASKAVTARQPEVVGESDAPGPVSQTYVVKSGDTPAAIAQEHLGDASRWTEIARVNPGLEAKSLKIGQTLRLPEGASGQAAGAQVAATVKKPITVPGVPAPSGEPLAVHRVAQGDTLYKLARKYYGDSSHWKLIQDANPTMVGGGVSAMRLDSELIIPALPGAGQ